MSMTQQGYTVIPEFFGDWKDTFFLRYDSLPEERFNRIYYYKPSRYNINIVYRCEGEGPPFNYYGSESYYCENYETNPIYKVCIKNNAIGFMLDVKLFEKALLEGEMIPNRKFFFDLIYKNRKGLLDPDAIDIDFYDKKKAITHKHLCDMEVKRTIHYHSKSYIKLGCIYIDYNLKRFYTNEPAKSVIDVKSGIYAIDSDNIEQKRCFADLINNGDYEKKPLSFTDKIIENIVYPFYINTNATLIMTKKEKIPYWAELFEDPIIISCKSDYGKLIYKDFVDTKVVIMSYNFLSNANYCEVLNGYTGDYQTKIDTYGIDLSKSANRVNRKNPLIALFNWKRLIMDDIVNVNNNINALNNAMQSISADFKWCIYICSCVNSYMNNKHTMYNKYIAACRYIMNYVPLTHDFHVQIKDHYFLYDKPKTRVNVKHRVKTHFIENTLIEKMLYNYYSCESRKTESIIIKYCGYPQGFTNGRPLIEFTKSISEIRDICVSQNNDCIEREVIATASMLRAMENLRGKIEQQIINGATTDMTRCHMDYVMDQLSKSKTDRTRYEQQLRFIEESFDRIMEGDLNPCAICLYDIDKTNFGVVSCGHTYCSECIVRMYAKTHEIAERSRCYVCRANVTNYFIYDENVVPDPDVDYESVLRCGSKVTEVSKRIAGMNEKMLVLSANSNTLKVVMNNVENNYRKNRGNRANKNSSKKLVYNKKGGDITFMPMSDFNNNVDLVTSIDFSRIIVLEPNLNDNLYNRVKTMRKTMQIDFFLMKDTIEESLHKPVGFIENSD